MREKVSKIAHEYAVINLFLFIYAYEYSIKDVFSGMFHTENHFVSRCGTF